jgi:hypothetical protein
LSSLKQWMEVCIFHCAMVKSNYAVQRVKMKVLFYLLSHLINIHRISYKTFVFLCPYLACPTKVPKQVNATQNLM